MKADEIYRTQINLLELLAVLMDKLLVIILCTVIFGVLAFGYAKLMITPFYNSTTQVYVLYQNSNDERVTSSDLSAGSLLTKDYEILIRSRAVLENVIDDLHLAASYDELSKMINVTTEADTRILSITVKDIDAKRAKTIADKVRELSAEHIEKVMDNQYIKVVDEANLPSKPAGPNLKSYALKGMALGFILSCGVITIIFILNDKIRTPEDIEKYLEISTLGSIPVYSTSKNTDKKNKIVEAIKAKDIEEEEEHAAG